MLLIILGILHLFDLIDIFAINKSGRDGRPEVHCGAEERAEQKN